MTMRSRMWMSVWMSLLLLGLGAFMVAPAWGADRDPFEKAATSVNSAATTSAGSQQVAGKIASELNASCACSTFSASSVTNQRTETGWGWGEVLIADRLALAVSQQSNVPFSTALSQVTTARQQGAGWGAIANANGLNVGKLVSGVAKSANAVANAGNDAAKGGQSHKGVAALGAGPDNGARGVGAGAGHGAAGAAAGQGGGDGAGHGGGGGGGGQGGGAGGGGGGGKK